MCELLPEAVTVSFYNKRGTRYGITWQTAAAGHPILEYTEVDDPDFLRSTVVCGKAEKTSAGMYKNSAVTGECRPGDRLLYRVGDESGVFSSSETLRVPPDDTHRSAFLLFSDTQDDCNRGAWWRIALDDAVKLFPDFDYIVHGGDIVQTSISRDEWREMLAHSSKYTRAYPLVAAVGNHDYWKGYLNGCTSTFYNHFNIELPMQDTSNGAYYSVRRGNMLICVLSSGDAEITGGALSEPQYKWLEEELYASSAHWKIAVIHNPMYSPGKYGSREVISKPCTELRRQLSALLEKGGVDLVISGHDHMLARTYPVGGDMEPRTKCETCEGLIAGRTSELFVSPGAPIHFIPACAGNQNRGIEDPHTQKQLSYFREMREMTGRETAYAAVEADDRCMYILFRVINADSKECVFESAFGIKKDRKSK